MSKQHKASGDEPVEIERKFLVDPKKLPDLSRFEQQSLRQGYLHVPISVKMREDQTRGVLIIQLSSSEKYKVTIPSAHVAGLLKVLEQRAKNPSARIRLSKSPKGKEAWITIKGKSAAQLAQKQNLPAPTKGGFGKAEFEYPIPYEEAKKLYRLCDHKLAKIRYHVSVLGHTWDVDEYLKELKDLWTAEVELKTEDEKVIIPPWCIKEVTGHPDLTNHGLAKGSEIPKSVKNLQHRLVALALRL